MAYYSLVVIATVMFAVQFLFNQKFQQNYGSNTKATLVFTLYKSAVATVIMLVISGFKVKITPFSLLLAAISAVSGILMLYFSLKAFSVANLSVYSIFTMLGGMLLPFAFGVISGVIEPLGACLTILVSVLVVPLLPFFLSFAAGAMIYVVVNELIPELSDDNCCAYGIFMFSLGFSVMMSLDVALG